MKTTLVLTCACAFAISTLGPATASERRHHHHGKAEHVLLLSIDGFHQSDLERYVADRPTSALAGLLARGTQYTNTTSSRPSDTSVGYLRASLAD